MDLLSRDSSGELAFASDSDNSIVEETITSEEVKDGNRYKNIYVNDIGKAVQDSMIESPSPTEAFFQDEDEKMTVKEYFHDRMRAIDLKKHAVWNMNQVTTEFAQELTPVLKKTSNALLTGQLKSESAQDVFDCTPDEILMTLTNYNWSNTIRTRDGRVQDVLTDLDNIYVVHRMSLWQRDKRSSPLVALIDMTIDV